MTRFIESVLADARIAWGALSIVLLLLLAATLSIGMRMHTNIAHTAERTHDLELHMLGTILHQVLQRGDYEDIDQLVKEWGQSSDQIAAIQVVARTGMVMGTYVRNEETAEPISKSSPIDYSYRGRADLTITKDRVASMRQLRIINALLAVSYLITSTFIAVVLLLWRRRHNESVLLKQQRAELTKTNERLLREQRQRARTERALSHAQQRAEVTLQSIHDAVLTTDTSGHIDSANSAAASMLAAPAETLIGRPVDDVLYFVNEYNRMPVTNPVHEALETSRAARTPTQTLLCVGPDCEHAVDAAASPLRDDDGEIVGCVLTIHDVTEQRRIQKHVEWQAGHDSLTGLPNRTLLADRLAQARANAQRNQKLLAVCFVDLDGFKQVNDRLGHEMGDAVLKSVAERLSGAVREGDSVARLGGDEFIVLLTDLGAVAELEPAVTRLLAAVCEPYVNDAFTPLLSASVGVTLYPRDNADDDTLLRHADHAMYLAKQSGRNRFHLFDPEHETELQIHHQQLTTLRTALRRGELHVLYQPRVNLRTGEVTGMEALLRWKHPERGTLGPREFLPWMEQSDLIIEVGEWVIENALSAISEWLDAGISMPVSVNVTAAQLARPDFPTRLGHCLERHPQVDSRLLELELVESTALYDLKRIREAIEACRALRITIALDDFGTGYSSLSHLRDLPSDILKIDHSFVRNMLDNADDLALVEGVVGLGRAFHRTVVAEGVELPEHGIMLMRMGCDSAQGYGIARPLPRDAVIPWVKQFTPDPHWVELGSVPWNPEDVPLLVAKLEHGRWVSQIVNDIEEISGIATHYRYADHHQCRFGRWYDSIGRQRYERLPEFAAIEATHVELHRIAPAIGRLRKAGRVTEARARIPYLLALQSQLIDKLNDLQAATAGHTHAAPLHSETPVIHH